MSSHVTMSMREICMFPPTVSHVHNGRGTSCYGASIEATQSPGQILSNMLVVFFWIVFVLQSSTMSHLHCYGAASFNILWDVAAPSTATTHNKSVNWAASVQCIRTFGIDAMKLWPYSPSFELDVQLRPRRTFLAAPKR